MRLRPSTYLLLGVVTILAASSFLFGLIVPGAFEGGFNPAGASAPLLIGCVCTLMGYKVWNAAGRLGGVGIYLLLLLPFAFGYPAWIVLLVIAYLSGQYSGPMP